MLCSLFLLFPHLASFPHNFFVYKPIQPKLQAYKQDIYVYISHGYQCFRAANGKVTKLLRTQNSEKFFPFFVATHLLLSFGSSYNS